MAELENVINSLDGRQFMNNDSGGEEGWETEEEELGDNVVGDTFYCDEPEKDDTKKKENDVSDEKKEELY